MRFFARTDLGVQKRGTKCVCLDKQVNKMNFIKFILVKINFKVTLECIYYKIKLKINSFQNYLKLFQCRINSRFKINFKFFSIMKTTHENVSKIIF